METRKIAIACFIGGALCCIVALMVTPVYWWLGLIAGMAGGYVSYEFREVCRAVPVALRSAWNSSGRGFGEIVKLVKFIIGDVIGLGGIILEYRQFFYPAVITTTILLIFGLTRVSSVTYSTSEILVGFTLCFIFVTVVLTVILYFLAIIGSRNVEKCYWPGDLYGSEITELEDKGLKREEITYKNATRWMIKGLRHIILFFVWTLWVCIAITLRKEIRTLGQFFWHMFKLIHSEKRVLCAIDGTLGGAVSYIYLHSTTMSVKEQVVIILFGGLLGAALGVLNWEIVSKRILRIVPANNR